GGAAPQRRARLRRARQAARLRARSDITDREA
ncbi:MAG: hypothetical protein AVDCRST_MAG53-1663, partial [uncultured Solirubrobacteraceae bacterium]